MYGGVYRIGFSPHYCIVFHYIWDKKSTAVQLISCQLFGQLISLELRSHTLETTFTPEQSICTVGVLTTSNLAYAAVLLDCQRPTLMASMNISFINFFFVLGWRFVLSDCCPSLYVTWWIPHLSHAWQRSAKQKLFPFVGCSQDLRLKDLCSKPFLTFTKKSLNGRLQ